MVTVVARESTQVQSQQTIVVERREPRVAQETHAKPASPLEPGKTGSRRRSGASAAVELAAERVEALGRSGRCPAGGGRGVFETFPH